jgi:hypothetical protein
MFASLSLDDIIFRAQSAESGTWSKLVRALVEKVIPRAQTPSSVASCEEQVYVSVEVRWSCEKGYVCAYVCTQEDEENNRHGLNQEELRLPAREHRPEVADKMKEVRRGRCTHQGQCIPVRVRSLEYPARRNARAAPGSG